MLPPGSTHLHKHLARTQAEQLVGGHARVGAANPAGSEQSNHRLWSVQTQHSHACPNPSSQLKQLRLG